MNQVEKLLELRQIMNDHGFDFVSGLGVFIAGLYMTKWVVGYLKHHLGTMIKSPATVSILSNALGMILLVVVFLASSIQMGANPRNVIAFLMIVSLLTIGMITIFRPLIPTLPFKVGNTVKIGDLLGKVEATSFLNTRLRTFDGKTFFVPNRKILDDIVINYHFTKTRWLKLDVTIQYDQDLAKTKRVLEAIMIEDARILPKPSPMVYVLNLAPDGVLVSGRAWVDNSVYWVTKCDLTEKIKFRFDQENLLFAYPQLEIHYSGGSQDAGSS